MAFNADELTGLRPFRHLDPDLAVSLALSFRRKTGRFNLSAKRGHPHWNRRVAAKIKTIPLE